MGLSGAAHVGQTAASAFGNSQQSVICIPCKAWASKHARQALRDSQQLVNFWHGYLKARDGASSIKQWQVLQDRELHKYILRSAAASVRFRALASAAREARGDAEPNEALQRRSEDFNKARRADAWLLVGSRRRVTEAISRATAAMLGSMATSLAPWIG